MNKCSRLWRCKAFSVTVVWTWMASPYFLSYVLLNVPQSFFSSTEISVAASGNFALTEPLSQWNELWKIPARVPFHVANSNKSGQMCDSTHLTLARWSPEAPPPDICFLILSADQREDYYYFFFVCVCVSVMTSNYVLRVSDAQKDTNREKILIP